MVCLNNQIFRLPYKLSRLQPPLVFSAKTQKPRFHRPTSVFGAQSSREPSSREPAPVPVSRYTPLPSGLGRLNVPRVPDLILPPNTNTRGLFCLLQNSKAHADTLLEQQQAFEEALVRNDATHEARLRQLKREAEEHSARQAETATVSVAAASAAAIGAHGRQAGAAVAAMAAAGIQAQTQQASAMAAQAAMFLEFQVGGALSCSWKVAEVCIHDSLRLWEF